MFGTSPGVRDVVNRIFTMSCDARRMSFEMKLDVAAEARPRARWPVVFWGLLLVAAALRIAAFDAFSAHHPDEKIQYLEQAHRLVFGYGIVPWEFRYFIRSWLIPLALAMPMRVGEWLDPGGMLYLVLPRALVAIGNSVSVVAAWKIGERVSRQHAIVAMAVAATWVECVLFQVQTLSESMAVACFLVAVVLIRDGAATRRTVAAGCLMALAGLLRFQLGPAIAAYALLVAGKDWRLWRGLVLGGVPVLIGGAAIDLAMGLYPYQWILTNYQMNIGQDRMREIGGVSVTAYITDIVKYWGIAAPFLFVLAFASGKAMRPLLLAALVNIAVHQLIGHKEYRYLWFSLQIILILAAIGSVNVARVAIGGLHPRWRPASPAAPLVTALIVLAWGTWSAAIATSDLYRYQWRVEGGASRLAALAAKDPRVCGIGVPTYRYTEFGYAFVHRQVPIVLLRGRELPSLSDPGAVGPAINAIITERKLTPPRGYGAPRACNDHGPDQLCLYLRPGGCTATPVSREREFQTYLNTINL